RITRLKERIAKLEEQARELSDQAKLQSELQLIIGRLEDFTLKVKNGLDQADWDSKRDLIRALVKRVEVEKSQVNVVFRVDQLPFESSPARGSLQHCGRRNFTSLNESDSRWVGIITGGTLPSASRSSGQTSAIR